MLDNITLFWLTNTGISAARLYWENKLSFFDPKNVSIPVAVSIFPDEIDAVPRSWAERAYPNLIYYNQVPKGGHFAAWEQPNYLPRRCARDSSHCGSAKASRRMARAPCARHRTAICCLALACRRGEFTQLDTKR